ncbi:HalOD1 output domain-containing protein [Natrinema sp. 1APR25-10V2]|uniref:HalOD1 output domain-containing protein n=1 Tax=Natrinema sp. 1APR25-10V2 TaxID=2951081 RepID=UPI002874EA63|nr:HalOD1 output domain-containing protein [Natrinema sp. 1APR25-10V2]MDS0477977.1 hypothetical protein [Natrinema sp. 1APR25-10V2]
MSLRVVRKVADREEVDPVELTPPLHSVIDTEALDSLFESTNRSDRTGSELEFRYNGYTVHVDSGGGVQVVDSKDSSETVRHSPTESLSE